MSECSHCGSEVEFGFVCKLCSRRHCQSHRLPETHDCPNIEHALPPGRDVTAEMGGEWNETPYVPEKP